MICFRLQGFSAEQLSDTFSKAMFCNSLVAISAGFIANFAAVRRAPTLLPVLVLDEGV